MTDIDTLVVNLFAGPGTGKSTNTALVYGDLKVHGVDAEIVHEFAKDLVWEGRHRTLTYQPYIAVKQMWHIERVRGQVDVIVTDSPILLSLIYGVGRDSHFGKFVLETFRSWNTLNILLYRNVNVHPYVESGRYQSLDEAREIDRNIKAMLIREEIPYQTATIFDGRKTANEIYNIIQERRRG